MKNIALSIEQMKHLASLGLDTSDASMQWDKHPNDDEFMLWIRNKKITGDIVIPAYTLQDILEKLPRKIDTGDYDNWFELTHFGKTKWSCSYCYDASDPSEWSDSGESESILDASYNLLCWCIKNGYLCTKK